ncbi:MULTISPECIES: SH3 domain-containing protein [unclassified Mesorhizobium]|uniref:SH3 domain-containing protein n=1 Tax=unclassified Mesorhizobium TaxID=325217 RepID=UPI002484BECE|nr:MULTISPECIES: SH3 domain-containing protein [unclassified Mesorhizobium]
MNMRVGPGTQYDVEWVYVRPRIPLEIYQEYGNWRRVRDWQGTSGWVFGPLLSGRRTAVTAPWSKDKIALRRKPSVSSLVTAWLAPEVIVELVRCDGQWCRVAVNSLAGFVRQTRLWGIYPNDTL